MARYHLSPTVGPAKCRAEYRCEFADNEGNEPQHYSSLEDAERAYETQLTEQLGSTSTVSNYDSGIERAWEIINEDYLLESAGEIEVENCSNTGYGEDWITMQDILDDPGLASGNCSSLAGEISSHSDLKYFEVSFKDGNGHAANYYTAEDGRDVVVDFTAHQYDSAVEVPLVLPLEEWRARIDSLASKRYGNEAVISRVDLF